MTALWLDCDTGHDDAFAILLAARHPTLDLLGISTVYGNAPVSKTTYNTRAILRAIAREDVPVYAGASKPLKRETFFASDIHGESGLDGTTHLPVPQIPEKHDFSAPEAMYRALSAQPQGTAWLVATGALTNVANLIATYPLVVSHIAGLSIMGGAIGDGFTDAPLGKVEGQGVRFGNWTPYAEFNIYCDPEAAAAIFSNEILAAKTTLIPLDLTHKFLGTRNMQYGLLFGFGVTIVVEPTMETVSTTRRLFFEILTYFSRTYAEVFGLTQGPPMHDPLAVAVIFAPELFICNVTASEDEGQGERFKVQVVTEGEHSGSGEPLNGASQCGRTIATLLPLGQVGVRIPRGLEAKEIWGLLEGCLWRTEVAIGRQTPTNWSHMRGQESTEIKNLEDFQGDIQDLMSTITKKSKEGEAESWH
nr:uridine nucleosidase [Quercus suber]